MPYALRTPESLLPRSDSKNPAATCNGITTTGRPCRRPIIALASAARKDDVVELDWQRPRSVSDTVDNARLFCWQHKNQAQSLALVDEAVTALKPRDSFDTILEHLGVLHLDDQRVPKHKSLPLSARGHAVQLPQHVPSAQKRPRSVLVGLCCWLSPTDDDEYLEIVRHKTRLGKYADANGQSATTTARHNNDRDRKYLPETSNQDDKGGRRGTSILCENNSQIPIQQPPPITDRNMWASVPQHLPSAIRAQLFAEMVKPISTADEEGFIYIFWLTDTKITAGDHLAAMLEQMNGENVRGKSGQEEAETMTRKSSSMAHLHVSSCKFLIKIGRATNVHRRLASWTHQCGYHLSLVRFYPHVRPSEAMKSSFTRGTRSPKARSSGVPFGPAVRKVPYSHRVERLVHIELSDRRARQGRCQTCGTMHREWFEIEPSREGLKLVDEVISRWVAWAERLHDSLPGGGNFVVARR